MLMYDDDRGTRLTLYSRVGDGDGRTLFRFAARATSLPSPGSMVACPTSSPAAPTRPAAHRRAGGRCASPRPRAGSSAAMTLDSFASSWRWPERQHVTRAAEALNLVQSAVSTAIANIEGRHATKLFHRVGRGIELTEAGRVFLVEARAVLARAEAAELVLADLSGMRRGTLALYASQTIASDWLPRHLVAFRRTYPEIACAWPCGQHHRRRRRGARRAGRTRLRRGGRWTTRRLRAPPSRGTNSFSWSPQTITSPGRPPSHRRPRRGRLGAARGWIGNPLGLRGGAHGGGLAPAQLRVTLELPSNEAVRAAVEAGGGATVLSETVVAAAIRAGTLVAGGVRVAKPTLPGAAPQGALPQSGRRRAARTHRNVGSRMSEPAKPVPPPTTRG